MDLSAQISPQRGAALRRFPLFGFLLALAVVGCAPVQDDLTPTPGESVVYRLPWFEEGGGYALQDVSLTTFSEPSKLRGALAEIIVDPRVNGSGLTSEEPIGRWVQSGSKMIPADFLTLQAATIYAHLEKLAAIDVATGLSSHLGGRAKIGLSSRISDGSGQSQALILNNAIYDGRLDTLFIVPYTSKVGLAISLNAGIIGHEHFHRVFQSIVLSRIREAARVGTVPYGWDDAGTCAWNIQPETSVPVDEPKFEIQRRTLPLGQQAVELVPQKVFNQVLVRGVNEGFADFWGWAYSRDDEFVGRSLNHSEDQARRLDKPTGTIPLKAVLRQSLIGMDRAGYPVLKSEAGRTAAAYRFGTEYARILRSFVEALVSEAEMDRNAAVVKVRLALATSMQDVSDAVVAKWGTEELEPEVMLKPLVSKLLKMSSEGPAVLNAKSSTAICRELVRLKASASLKSGLCGDFELRLNR